MTIFTVLACWLLADVLTGVIHWWEDHYLTSESKWKFLAQIAQDNELHHAKPEAMGRYSMWENINTSAPYGVALAAVLFYFGAPMLVWLTVFFASFGNLVHRFSHVPKSKIPLVVQWLQKTGLFISTKHHNKHHRDFGLVVSKKDSSEKFCPMTDWMNPLLDKIKFFKFLEYLLSLVGIHSLKS